MNLIFQQPNFIQPALLSDILSISKRNLEQWEAKGKAKSYLVNGKTFYDLNDFVAFEEVSQLINSEWDKQANIKPKRKFTSVELFAGAGGLAIGLEQAGFSVVALNEIDKDACATLKENRPQWNVIHESISNVDFKSFHGVDFLSGGFPCQAFSYAGKQLGFEDTRGTLFFEFARVVKETQPKVFIAENVRGLLTHDNGRTIDTIKKVIAELGYQLVEPKVLKAIFYKVPQKRERLFLVAVRNDLADKANFSYPTTFNKVLTVKDALKAGELYPNDVPDSIGQTYPTRKAEILSYVPQGGYWRDLPEDIQREYMKGSFHLEGGKTGMARRLSWDEPSLTLTCAPAQKQTERCHPEENRPLTVREYARIQTFPDSWSFKGSLTSQYKQIGNAVPVNLGFAMGKQLINLLNKLD